MTICSVTVNEMTEQDESLTNKADFSDCETLEEKIEKHNENVAETMERAKDGETINLTDLLGQREQLHIEDIERRHWGER